MARGDNVAHGMAKAASAGAPVACEEPPTAQVLEDLRLLHDDGLEVVWPSGYRPSYSGATAGRATSGASAASAHLAVAASTVTGPLSDEIVQDLKLLEESGFSVIWPC